MRKRRRKNLGEKEKKCGREEKESRREGEVN